MRKTSVLLFIIALYWLILAQALLLAQQLPRAEHSQGMHQYVVREAYRLLQREAPGTAAKLHLHLGSSNVGSGPWQAESILAGAYREDEEDIVYGYGGALDFQQPGLSLGRVGTCLDGIYDILEEYIRESKDVRPGLVSVTHFWDEHASDNVIRKSDIKVVADWPVSCLDTDVERLEITPVANAWDKIQRLLRPHWSVAILDKWWTPDEKMYDSGGIPFMKLPAYSTSMYEIRVRYNTLADLFNTGNCSIELSNNPTVIPVVLTQAQRKRYVWEILGRACHLLADMSVPAHTHKDMHMGNVSYSEGIELIHMSLAVVRLSANDEDSYESWIGNTMNAYWTADMIQDGLLPLAGISDPLYYLMSSMRAIAASFASDDADGSGPVICAPRYASEIPNRYNIPATIGSDKAAMLIAIRDHTLPYAIRATATLLHWFASQLDMQENYKVWTEGAEGYSSYFVRKSHVVDFPVVATQSGTSFTAQAGSDLSLRAHYTPHHLTSAKFICWRDLNGRMTTMHQWDDYVISEQEDVSCHFHESSTALTPRLGMVDELSLPLCTVYPLFKNPWHVNPLLSDNSYLEQRDIFEEYKPVPAADANGGIFIDLSDDLIPAPDYYSIRASKVLDGYTKAHKATAPEVGDYAFVGWEGSRTKLLPDPRNSAWPPVPAYANAQEYDTKKIDFETETATLDARYKKHRTSDHLLPVTKTNSQRKVAMDEGEVYHATYESSGRIWYVRSTDRGVSWSGEELVSDASRPAERPSVATMGRSAWITYVSGGEVVLRVQGNGAWETVYSAPVTMTQDCTPAVAALRDYDGAAGLGAVVCLVWEDVHELRFAMLQLRNVIVDNKRLAAGRPNSGGIDQPRFPSVAASTMMPSKHATDHGFHVAWLENGSIQYTNLTVDRSSHPVRLWGWQPGGAVNVETVHARTGSLGVIYPARHAPSVAVTEQGTVHVAFDVLNWNSPWPTHGATIGTPTSPTVGLAGMFALRERPLPTLHGPTWQTTTTLVGGSSYSTLCSPTVGAKPAAPASGGKSNALRVIYNDAQGQLRVARFDGSMSIDFHAEGWDPSVTAWAPRHDALLDVYSYTAQQPYAWHMLSSRNALAKAADDRLLRMRQLLLGRDERMAAVGLAMPRLRSTGGQRPVDWDETHDSLVIGIDTDVSGKMRTAVFTPEADEKLLVDVEHFGLNNEDTRAEILLRINDAFSGEALRVLSIPVNAFAAVAAMAVREFDLSGISGRAVFMCADVQGHGEKWSVDVVDRYAVAGEMPDEGMEKTSAIAAPRRPVLRQNHPNPFNPSTGITYHLPEAGDVRLAVYNLLGQEVALLEKGWRAAGEHRASFDGAALPSGVYLYRLECGGATQTRSMHLLK